MDCALARELLSDELDGRLDAAAAALLTAHLSSCPACAEERRGLASLRATFRAMPRVPAPPGLRDSVMNSLPSGRRLDLPRTLGWLAAVAALVVVAVTLLPGSPTVRERTVADARTATTVQRERGDAGAGSAQSAALEAAKSEAPSAEQGAPEAAPGPKATARGAAGEKEEDAAAAAESVDRDAAKLSGGPPPAAPEPGETLLAVRTLYVVFRDAAQAEKFARELTAPRLAEKKDKSAAPADAPVAGGTPSPLPVPPDAKRFEESETWRGGPLKYAAFASRRVIARTSLPGPGAPDDLAARVAAADGAIVSDLESAEFAALLDAVEGAQGVGGAGAGGGAAGRDDESRRKSRGAVADDAGLRKTANLMVVIVLLESAPPVAPPRPGGEPR